MLFRSDMQLLRLAGLQGRSQAFRANRNRGRQSRCSLGDHLVCRWMLGVPWLLLACMVAAARGYLGNFLNFNDYNLRKMVIGNYNTQFQNANS